jgi:hypothetical protein
MSLMTLDEEYPEAEAGFRDPLGFAKGIDAKPCQQCGVLTAWEHIALAMPICCHVCFNRYMALPGRDPSPSSAAISGERRALLAKVLDELPADYR